MTINYKQSGVDIEKGDLFIDSINKKISTNFSKNVIGKFGSFGGSFDISNLNVNNPVLVSSTDGVGTKIIVANQVNDFSSIGIDLVAMCVNDILCHGARPLFFLDYIATGIINIENLNKIVDSIIKGCNTSGIPLIGGETAEMKEIYKKDTDIDLSGFVVGIVDKEKMLPRDNVKDGDIIIGFKSSGFHSNGFTLIRKVFSEMGIDYKDNSIFYGKSWSDILLKPTLIYVNEIFKIIDIVKGIAHITGGGLLGNLKRIVKGSLSVDISYNIEQWPDLFKWLNKECKVNSEEMKRVFNCGIGMSFIIDPNDYNKVLSFFENDEIVVVGKICDATTVN
ncbi:MAG: phosphoribosylformylglycinamidine cyclo-ligase [Candidatus Xenolissoclinum pacificiensis L6]|uniref:Phosphoribosylformylglycinamidine cyclo-ligase n=1 Tax=Candidatus Xenolissoclinum pacificiensis L6 TaxID=1401685 RepID=W2V070_9RICK|nr:MAG: phosphoribosylformylglycinamidine cyclo-ligase [Candidatus Xenolissoclinum pacificiensis L6]